MNSIEKLNLLLDQIEEASLLRQNNINRVSKLYKILNLEQKNPDISTLFEYAAINLAGIGLREEDFGEIREGRYVQIIAIDYEIINDKKKTRNSSLGYYGKAEKLEKDLKKYIIEFVLRWRYEKSFQHSDHYKQLLAKIT
ncbi:MAG TPA: hypothetical protein ENK82_00380 [Campylobacterales bacterium]|nr:hypothetical protein [Campylobacterales bacterium]HHS91778.1 hypothetical protein [Campylobacterales bacterium]